MQIHELTRKRPIKEGVLGAAGAALGGVASQLVNKAAAAQGLNPVVGGQSGTTSAGAQSAATAANSPLIKGLATSAAKEWKETVSELMQTMKTPTGMMATRPSELPADKLRKPLEDLVSRLIGTPYQTLVTQVSAEAHDGQGKQYAAELTDTIDDQIDAIVSQEQTDKPDPNKESALWTTVAQAITGAKSEMEFSSSNKTGVAARPGSMPAAAQQLADQSGMSDQTVAALQNHVRLGGGKLTPALQALLGVTK